MSGRGEEAGDPILVTGASGFIGSRLCADLLASGRRVTGIGLSSSRPAPGPGGSFTWVSADTTRPGPWQEWAGKSRVIINLAGRNIFQRWTRSRKEKIYRSRIETTRNLVDAVPPGSRTVLLSASAVGFYGDRGEEELTERSPAGGGFLARVCSDWEREALAAREKGARVALMRFAVVLGREGGALAKMVPVFRVGLGGPLGRGRHWFPWIHLDDLAAAAGRIIADPELSGPINFTAPEAIRQGDFARRLGATLHRPAILPVPPVLLRLVLGELGRSLLESQRVRPARLEQAGFPFAHPRLAAALENILG